MIKFEDKNSIRQQTHNDTVFTTSFSTHYRHKKTSSTRYSHAPQSEKLSVETDPKTRYCIHHFCIIGWFPA